MFIRILRNISLLAVVVMSPLLLMTASAGAQSKADVCSGIGLATGAGGNTCAPPANSTDINDIIRTVINLMSVIVGIIAVIMIIFGGYKFITSDGDAGKIAGARQTIIYALVGLIVVALAQTVSIFILRRVT